MPKRLTAHSMTVPELLLSGSAFSLPPSQRVYGWGEQELDRMFRDIDLDGFEQAPTPADEPDHWFFFGTIYLARDQTTGAIYIADGQQRFVTGTMLYAAARDLETDATERARLNDYVEASGGGFRLRLRDVDAAFFQAWVQLPGATLRPFQSDLEEAADGEGTAHAMSESQANIIRNRDAIVARLKALAPEARRRFIRHVETCTEVIVISAGRLDDATSAYASTYKRGLRQATTDQLKAELLGDAEPQVRAHLGNHWDECEARIGKDELEILLYLLTLQRTRSAATSDLQTDVLKHFNLPAEVRSFVETRLVPATEAYRHILGEGRAIGDYVRSSRLSRATARIANHLVVLNRTTHIEWRLPAIVALQVLREDAALLELTLKRLERLAAAYMIAGQDPQAMVDRYTALVDAIETRNATAIETASEVEKSVASTVRTQLLSATFATKSRFRMPVLLKINDLIEGKVSAFKAADVSCEHILPQNVNKYDREWYAGFRSVDGKRYIGFLLKHRLGNVTVVSHPLNRQLGSKPYSLKRPLLKTSQHAAAVECAQHPEWTATVIEERSQRLAAMILRHWDL